MCNVRNTHWRSTDAKKPLKVFCCKGLCYTLTKMMMVIEEYNMILYSLAWIWYLEMEAWNSPQYKSFHKSYFKKLFNHLGPPIKTSGQILKYFHNDCFWEKVFHSDFNVQQQSHLRSFHNFALGHLGKFT